VACRHQIKLILEETAPREPYSCGHGEFFVWVSSPELEMRSRFGLVESEGGGVGKKEGGYTELMVEGW
jgi:hypothetical protein